MGSRGGVGVAVRVGVRVGEGRVVVPDGIGVVDGAARVGGSTWVGEVVTGGLTVGNAGRQALNRTIHTDNRKVKRRTLGF